MTEGDLIGKTLGRYRIEAKIGQGGMGTVFRAIDEKLRRPVALKVLSDGVVNDPDRRRRFLREARVAAAITHPHIATVHDVGETDDGHIYIAMELIAGPSLRQWIERGAMGGGTALRIAKDLTRALVKAHKLGIVHRDLKPDNIMVSEELEVKVLDFGLAKPLELVDSPEGASVITEAGQLLGTPGYMPPEQAAGRAVDGRTDIFAIGVILYEMATGARPFRGSSSIDIIIATARDEPAPPSTIVAGLSANLERVILRCLEKNADARYADAPELMQALDDLGDAADASPRHVPSATAATDAGSLPTQATLIGTAGPLNRRRTRPWMVMAGFGAAVLLAIGATRFQPSGSTRAHEATTPSATALTELPVPPSTSAALRAEYAAGMQALRDDDWGTAQAHFSRVVEIDPFLAIGQLRLAMVAEGTLDESIRREHYSQAVTLRSQLSARDEGMMEALEPILQRLREDRTEAVKRLRVLSERYPADVEMHVWLAILQDTNADGLASAERAIALDPRDGQAWQSRGDVLATIGRTVESRASYERCGTISPASAECFLGLIWLDSAEGQCAEAERDARRAVDRNPHLAGNLACVMYGAGRPVEAVREIIEQAAGSFAPNPWQTLMDRTRIALVAGDFVRARTLAEQYQSRVDATPHAPFREHLRAAEVLIGIARETGDEAQAFRVALDFAARGDTWSKSTQGDAGIDGSRAVERQAVRPGGMARSEFVTRRTAWIDAERRNVAHPGLTWTYAYAASAETADEANEALRVLPEYAPLSSVVHYAGIPDAEVGSTYLLAGRVEEAIPYLTRAVATCVAFRHPFVHTRAELQLGEALERTGNAPGACGAYQKVVDRWGKANPRSISAEKARARMTALACAK